MTKQKNGLNLYDVKDKKFSNLNNNCGFKLTGKFQSSCPEDD